MNDKELILEAVKLSCINGFKIDLMEYPFNIYSKYEYNEKGNFFYNEYSENIHIYQILFDSKFWMGLIIATHDLSEMSIEEQEEHIFYCTITYLTEIAKAFTTEARIQYLRDYLAREDNKVRIN